MLRMKAFRFAGMVVNTHQTLTTSNVNLVRSDCLQGRCINILLIQDEVMYLATASGANIC